MELVQVGTMASRGTFVARRFVQRYRPRPPLAKERLSTTAPSAALPAVVGTTLYKQCVQPSSQAWLGLRKTRCSGKRLSLALFTEGCEGQSCRCPCGADE